MKYIYKDLDQLGFYTVDANGNETFWKEYGDAKMFERYGMTCGHREIGNLVNYIAEHASLTAPAQRVRRLPKVKACSSIVFGEMTLGGKLHAADEAWTPNNLPLDGIISVTSDKVTRVINKVVDGKMTAVRQLLIPLDEEALATYAPYYYILDAQHSSSAMSDRYGKWENENDNFKSQFNVYMDLSEAEQIAIYDNKNFSADRAPADQELEHLAKKGGMEEDELFCYQIIAALATECFEDGYGVPNYSFMQKSIKLRQDMHDAKVTPAVLMRFAMYKATKKNKRYVCREENIVTSLSHPKLDFKRDASVYADKINLFMNCFNYIHGKTPTENINMFEVNTKRHISATKIAAAFSLVQPMADIIATNDGLSWNAASLMGLSALFRDAVLEHKTLLEQTLTGGGGDMYKQAAEWRKNLVTVSKNLSADEIIAMGKIR